MFFLAVLTLLGLSSTSNLIIVSSDGTLGPSPCAVTCAGTTKSGYTDWYGTNGQLSLNVDISACGFKDTPVITVTINGDSTAGQMAGTSSVFNTSKTGFTMLLRGFVQTAYYQSTYKPSVANAKSLKWSINWVAHGFSCI